MKDNRPFADVPRNLLTIAVMAGGIIGIVLTQTLHWSMFEGFIFTLVIAVAFALLAVVGYRAIRR